jgi:undecaprenyl-diphosphatase
MKVATCLADEHLLYAASLLVWLGARRGASQQREKADHFALAIVAANVVPHLVKRVVDRRRPDRYVTGPRHGIPISGKADDSFPSGHAVHIGALASAASLIEPKAKPWVWAGGLLLASTRIALLAHWTTDVAVGLLAGAGLERALRPVSARIFGRAVRSDRHAGRR